MKHKKVELVVVVVLMFIFQQMASKIGKIIAQLFDYSFIDKDNTFMWISVHHIVQLIIAGIAIYILIQIRHFEFGVGIKYSKIGIKYTACFTVVLFIYTLTIYIVRYFFHTITPYDYPLNAINVFGTLGFQLLLSGTSEEILFRALPITVFSNILECEEKKKTFITVMIAAVLFSLAHIKWSVYPSMTITVDWFQLVYALILGLIYGVTYRRTNSIIYPIIMHGMSNVLMVGIGYLFMTFT